MALFDIRKSKLTPIREKKIRLERDLQQLVEENLEAIFGLKFIDSEVTFNDKRLDTLAYDEESSSFVVIEYKRSRSFSVVDQGFSYLSLVVNNDRAFVNIHNEALDSNLRRDQVDWSQTRVIFIAQSFTKHQIGAISFRDLPIELWEVKLYENQTILFNRLESDDSSQSIDLLTKDAGIKKVSKEVKRYSVDDHFKESWTETRELYESFKESLFEQYPELKESPQKQYIGFKLGNNNVISVWIQKQGIKLVLNRHRPEDLKDPEKRVEYWQGSFERYNQHLSTFLMTNSQDLLYGMFLIKQVYDDFERKP